MWILFVDDSNPHGTSNYYGGCREHICTRLFLFKMIIKKGGEKKKGWLLLFLLFLSQRGTGMMAAAASRRRSSSSEKRRHLGLCTLPQQGTRKQMKRKKMIYSPLSPPFIFFLLHPCLLLLVRSLVVDSAYFFPFPPLSLRPRCQSSSSSLSMLAASVRRFGRLKNWTQ